MSNLKTNLFQGDFYIETSSDPLVYGSGNLQIEGDITVGGGITISGSPAITGANNVGVGGVGVYNSLSGSTLQFKNINAGSNKVNITNDSGNAEIDIDIIPGNILHSSLGDLTTTDDHTQYTLLSGRTGGQIITGGTASTNNLTLRSTSNATKGSVIIDETTSSTSTITGAFRVSGGVGIQGNTFIGGTTNSAGILSATSGTASSSISTGALVVTGGTGISGALNVGGNAFIGGNATISGSLTATISHSTLTNLTTGDDHTQYTLLAGRTGGQILTGGTAASNNLTLRSTSNATKGSVIIDETTTSTSTTTGALRVGGGVGVQGNVFIGGTTNSAGIITASSGTASSSTTTGAVVISGSGGLGVGGNVFIGGNASIAGTLNATISHSTLTNLTTADDHTQYMLLAGRTGGQILTGGTAASNDLTLRSTSNTTKGSVVIDETTASTSTSTGALRVGGGLGVVGAIYSGAGLFDSGNRVFSVAGTNLTSTGTTISVISNPSFSGIVSVTNSTATTTSSNGALLVAGGISSSNNTDATSSTNGGSLTLAGGAGIAKKVFIGDTLTVNSGINANNAVISNVGTPVNPTDAANKAYVDNAVQGIDIKNSVVAATTTSGTLNTSFQNGSVIDGITLATNDRILIKNQISSIENGVYIVQSSGAPIRSSDFASGASVAGAFLFVERGTTNAESGWVCTNDSGTDIVGTNGLNFVQFSGAGQIIAGTGLTKTGNELSVNSSQTQITAIGTLTTGTWNANIISVQYGGTGQSTFNTNEVLLGNGSSPISSSTGMTYSSNTLTLPKLISNDTTTSTSSSTGAVILSGGLGINNSTNATSATNGGALTVSGGAGFGGNVFIGGNATISGTLTATISHSTLTNLTTGDDHTQYTLLAGRTGGQILTGGTAASNNLTLRSTSNATKGSIIIDETTTSTSTTTGALRVGGGVGIQGNTFIGGTTNSAGILTASSGTASSSTTTGALVISGSGGLGVGGNTFIGGTTNSAGIFTASSGTASSSTTTGAVVISGSGGLGVGGNVFIGGNTTITGNLTVSGSLSLPSVSHSSLSNLTTSDDHTQYMFLAGRGGGQILTGGTGISNNLTLRSTSNATKGSVFVDETTSSTSTITGAFRVAGGVGIQGNTFIGGTTNSAGVFTASSNTASSSTTTGAIVISGSGGLGVGGNAFIGGTTNSAGVFTATSNTASTSTTTGAIIISGTGGLGVGGNVFIGGNATITGTVTATISHSSLTNLTTGDDHTQYTLLAGRTGGQILTGGTAASNNLTLRSTSNATKGSVIIDETTTSTSTTTGALRVGGGLGVVGATFIGGQLNATSGTPSTSTTTGALVISSTGGLGVGGSIFVGSNVSSPTITLPSTITITNPPASNIRLYQDNADGRLKSINSAGIIEIYQPTTTLGDIPVNNGTTLERFPVGNDTEMLIANSAEPLGLQWVPQPVFGTNFFFTRDPGTQTTTSNVFQTRLTLTTETLEAGNYMYVITGYQSCSTNDRKHEAQILLDSTLQNIASFEGRSNTEWVVYFSDIVALTAGVHTVELQYRRVAATTVTSRNILIYIYRVS